MAHVVALCGGVGGAKLALGLSRILGHDAMTLVVNTGDDFEHLGLHVSPDIDTVAYTLAGLSDAERGWGLQGETWRFMEALRRLGGEDWFQLGDQDLATHVERTRRLRAGESLSAVTTALASRLGCTATLAPMSDDPVATVLDTDAGRLSFQHYFVRERCAPCVQAIHFEGAATACPSTGFLAALERPDLEALLVCPSNPYLSIAPILAVPGVRERIAACRAPRVAVSPIIGGQAVKGPTAKLMQELGLPVDNASIARFYDGLVDGLVIDAADAPEAGGLQATGLAALACPTLMTTDADKLQLARASLAFARSLPRRGASHLDP